MEYLNPEETVFFIKIVDAVVKIRECVIDNVHDFGTNRYILRCEKEFNLVGGYIKYMADRSEIYLDRDEIFNYEFISKLINDEILRLKTMIADDYIMLKEYNDRMDRCKNDDKQFESLRLSANDLSKNITILINGINKLQYQLIDLDILIPGNIKNTFGDDNEN